MPVHAAANASAGATLLQVRVTEPPANVPRHTREATTIAKDNSHQGCQPMSPKGNESPAAKTQETPHLIYPKQVLNTQHTTALDTLSVGSSCTAEPPSTNLGAAMHTNFALLSPNENLSLSMEPVHTAAHT